MATAYENRLIAFATGKRLGRLSGMVRQRGVCDGCGSTLPRLFIGLRDTVSSRHYFLGQNCLAWLLANGLVARARYRESAQVAYQQEMELRRQEGIASASAAEPGKDRSRQMQLARPANGHEHVGRREPEVANNLAEKRALQSLGEVLEPGPRFQWVREDSALV